MILKKTNKIFFIILLFILFIVFKIRENFQTNSVNTDSSVTYIKTDDMNVKARLQQSTINLDPYSTDKNINIGNDIIIKNGFKINGYDHIIDIPFLRYMKYLPLHFEKEICLQDEKGSDCMNKKHLEIVKGERKINLKTYPENRKQCLGAKNIIHKKNIYKRPSSNFVFSHRDCEKGDHKNDFVFVREPHEH